MANRNKLPQSCWVTAFSSTLPGASGTDPALHHDRSRARHRHFGVVSGVLSGAPSSGSVSMPARASSGRKSARVRRRRRNRAHSHILPRELFSDTLMREQTRADRFDQPFVLVIVEIAPPSQLAAARTVPAEPVPSVWPRVVEVMTATVGDTGVLGWIDRDAVLGAIVTELTGSDPAILVEQRLAEHLDRATLARCSVRSQGYYPTAARSEASLSTDPVPHPSQPTTHRPPATYRIKRSLDIAGSLALLLLLSPVLLIIAALIKLTSPGPVLFRQTRIGQRAQPFTMLKFRTMRADADPALHHAFVTSFIRSNAQPAPVGPMPLFKLTNDPRVTPLGRLLRKSSLDELPQLWNVLGGTMSLVGPRPPLTHEVQHYRSWHWRRVLEARPGLTGLWQVTGRSRTTFADMVRLDLRYVRTCSLATDLRILLATPRAVLSGQGAV